MIIFILRTLLLVFNKLFLKIRTIRSKLMLDLIIQSEKRNSFKLKETLNSTPPITSTIKLKSEYAEVTPTSRGKRSDLYIY